jgi:predicted Zn-dependent protease
MAPVEPFSGLTFWEESGETQPYFLRAASLEQNRQWQELSELAQRWVAATPGDAEAFYTQGVAFDGLGQTDDSIRALKRCTEIDPSYSRGWSRLAQAYRRQGRAQDERVALAALATLDPDTAEQLSNEMEKP